MRFRLVCATALVLMAACDVGDEPLAAVEPASGDALVDYSAKIRDGVRMGKDAALFQLFCKNLNGSPCPEDIGEKLKTYGYTNGKTGIELGYAFSMMGADQKDGAADGKSSDADFIDGAYKAVFGRAADPGGIATYSAVIQGGTIESRKVMVQTILQSPEFKTLK
jgi:hypothetical protein